MAQCPAWGVLQVGLVRALPASSILQFAPVPLLYRMRNRRLGTCDTRFAPCPSSPLAFPPRPRSRGHCLARLKLTPSAQLDSDGMPALEVVPGTDESAADARYCFRRSGGESPSVWWHQVPPRVRCPVCTAMFRAESILYCAQFVQTDAALWRGSTQVWGAS